MQTRKAMAADRLTQLQDAVNFQAENFCNSIGILQQIAAASSFPEFQSTTNSASSVSSAAAATAAAAAAAAAGPGVGSGPAGATTTTSNNSLTKDSKNGNSSSNLASSSTIISTTTATNTTTATTTTNTTDTTASAITASTNSSSKINLTKQNNETTNSQTLNDSSTSSTSIGTNQNNSGGAAVSSTAAVPAVPGSTAAISTTTASSSSASGGTTSSNNINQDLVNSIALHCANNSGSTGPSSAGGAVSGPGPQMGLGVNEDHDQMFARMIARTAKDIDMLIDSLPSTNENDLNNSELIATSIKRLEQDNTDCAAQLEETIRKGEIMLERIQSALAEIAQLQLKAQSLDCA